MKKKLPKFRFLLIPLSIFIFICLLCSGHKTKDANVNSDDNFSTSSSSIVSADTHSNVRSKSTKKNTKRSTSSKVKVSSSTTSSSSPSSTTEEKAVTPKNIESPQISSVAPSEAPVQNYSEPQQNDQAVPAENETPPQNEPSASSKPVASAENQAPAQNYNQSAENAPATPVQTGSERKVYVTGGGKSPVYWYSTDRMPKNTDKNNLLVITEQEAINSGKRHSKTE